MVFAEIPINAIREALLNYKDRIEIYNSGTYGQLNMANIKKMGCAFVHLILVVK